MRRMTCGQVIAGYVVAVVSMSLAAASVVLVSVLIGGSGFRVQDTLGIFGMFFILPLLVTSFSGFIGAAPVLVPLYVVSVFVIWKRHYFHWIWFVVLGAIFAIVGVMSIATVGCWVLPKCRGPETWLKSVQALPAWFFALGLFTSPVGGLVCRRILLGTWVRSTDT